MFGGGGGGWWCAAAKTKGWGLGGAFSGCAQTNERVLRLVRAFPIHFLNFCERFL